MKKIIRVAWLGHSNYGDDLMSYVIDKWLDDRFGDVENIIMCEGVVKKTNSHRSIYFSPFFPKRINKVLALKQVKNSDVLVIGGGSILHSEQSIRWKQDVVNEARKKGIPAIGINLSIGPLKSELAEELCEDFLNSLNAFTLRDKASCDWAEKVNIRTPFIATTDLAGTFINQVKDQLLPKNKNIVGVSFVKTNCFQQIERNKKLLSFLATLYSKVKLFSFCTSATLGDHKMNQVLAHGLDNITVVDYQDTIEFTQELSECGFFIGERLHSIIVSYLLNTPFITLSYHKKCSDFLDLIGYGESLLDCEITDESNLATKIALLVKSKPAMSINEYISRSNKNIKAFDYV